MFIFQILQILNVSEATPKPSPCGPADIAKREKLQRNFFKSLKRRGLKVTFCLHEIKYHVQQHHFVFFRDVIINCYSNFKTCLNFFLALIRIAATVNEMDIFKSKKSKKLIQIITEDLNDFIVTYTF